MEIRTLESSRTATTPPPRVGDRMGDPPRSWSDGIPFLSKGNPLPLSHGRPVRVSPSDSTTTKGSRTSTPSVEKKLPPRRDVEAKKSSTPRSRPCRSA